MLDVRTSLSPDRVLRRRSRGGPGTSGDTTIGISSDDEADPPARRISSRRPTLPASHIPEVIDLTQLPSTPPPQLHTPSESSAGSSNALSLDNAPLATERKDAIPFRAYPVSSGRVCFKLPNLLCRLAVTYPCTSSGQRGFEQHWVGSILSIKAFGVRYAATLRTQVGI